MRSARPRQSLPNIGDVLRPRNESALGCRECRRGGHTSIRRRADFPRVRDESRPCKNSPANIARKILPRSGRRMVEFCAKRRREHMASAENRAGRVGTQPESGWRPWWQLTDVNPDLPITDLPKVRDGREADARLSGEAGRAKLVVLARAETLRCLADPAR